MNIAAVKCNVCDDIIYARCKQDNRYCSCGGLLVVGEDVLSGNYKKVEVDIPFTEQQLFDDWNFVDDKLGILYGYETDCGSKEILSVHREDSGRYTARMASKGI